jgi:hypothetical protein
MLDLAQATRTLDLFIDRGSAARAPAGGDAPRAMALPARE